MIVGNFPLSRPRRLRSSGWMRELCQENFLTSSHLILPLFVRESDTDQTIQSMPEIKRFTISELLPIVHEALMLGIKSVALFPVISPDQKDEKGTMAYREDNLVFRAIGSIKNSFPEIGVISDVALDPYTSHGQDGLLIDGRVPNDETLSILCEQALMQAHAGCDILAPSDMMDGRIISIRQVLEKNGFENVALMSYGAKYASSFYGPFRDALGTYGVSKDLKKTYQMNPANIKEALKEIATDIQEGADMIMVKPGMPYLDVIAKSAEIFHVPIFAYQVSGEYAMLKAAGQNGWLDFDASLMESLLSFKRAGAQGIFTYAALHAAKILNA